jgi:c-di-AMP phosphodiesterase-like protein
MKKEIKALTIRTLIFVTLEIILVILFAIFYFNDLFGIKTYLTTSSEFGFYLIVLAAVIIINTILMFYTFARVKRIRHKSDLEAATLLGGDVCEAYEFGMLGLIVVDTTDFTVLWLNSFAKERRFDIMDKNILDWQPLLRNISDGSSGDEIVNIEIDGKNYEVKYLPDAGLFIFKDTSDYEDLRLRYSKEAVVLGIIKIDNYSEDNTMLSNVTIMSKVRETVANYCSGYGVYARTYSTDSFYIVCDYESLDKMKKDSFSLLDKVRAIDTGSANHPTLSMGFAHGFPDVTMLSDMAQKAIDTALARGGDQAVVSKHGEGNLYYGGRTEASVNRNNVRSRVNADALLEQIRNANLVFIMGHRDADMDAVGACLGALAMCQYCNTTARIVYDSKLIERRARYAILDTFDKDEMSKMFIAPKDAIDKTKNEANVLIIVCDTSVPSRTICPELLNKYQIKIAVIDHHRKGEECVENPMFSFIEPSASSACEIIADLLHFASANPRIPLPASYATIMLSGIFLDTDNYTKSSCGGMTFEASMYLKDYGANNQGADDYLKDEFEEYSSIMKIASTMKTDAFGIVHCTADDGDILEESTIAKVADQCMHLKDIKACFVIGRTGEHTIKVSARGDGTVNVQLLMEKIGGVGGGRFSAAAAIFENASISDVEKQLVSVLKTYLVEASGRATIKSEGGNE